MVTPESWELWWLLHGYHFFGGLNGWLPSIWLVLTGTMEFPMTFPENIGNFIIPTDFHIYVIFLLEPRIMVNHGWLPQTTFLVIGRGFDPKHLGGHPASDSLAEKSSKHNMGKSSKNIKVIKTDHRKKKHENVLPLEIPWNPCFWDDMLVSSGGSQWAHRVPGGTMVPEEWAYPMIYRWF